MDTASSKNSNMSPSGLNNRSTNCKRHPPHAPIRDSGLSCTRSRHRGITRTLATYRAQQRLQRGVNVWAVLHAIQNRADRLRRFATNTRTVKPPHRTTALGAFTYAQTIRGRQCEFVIVLIAILDILQERFRLDPTQVENTSHGSEHNRSL
jgi:hypothetical protein